MRFHVLGIPHTVAVPTYPACPFTQKTLRLCRMLSSRGHEVLHYGHADAVVEAERVAVTTDADLEASYPGHDWRRLGPPAYRHDDPVFRAFNANANAALTRRKRRGDFLLCCFGNAHKAIAEANPDLIACEPGIGYPDGGFARFRVFESYAVMHAYLGMAGVRTMSDRLWYDAVIPNAYDPAEFAVAEVKDDYFLFLGRLTPGKGIHVALQTVEAVGGRLVIAGPGRLQGRFTRTDRPVAEYVEYVGVVGPERRRALLSRARCVLAPSMFVEPFCSVLIEALLSGTPVISTDWGALAENNIHGVTGYRCRTFEQFVFAARAINTIDPAICRSYAVANFSLERIADMYEEYFRSVSNLFFDKGWYAENPSRDELNWLNRYPPASGPCRLGPEHERVPEGTSGPPRRPA